ncbi:hypothetical protein BCC0191_004693 [Burkholderia ambifaria]
MSLSDSVEVVDVLTRLKAGDSHTWRCTSASENVQRSVGISIMHDTTAIAGPLSHSQSRDTFRPRRAVFRSARRTGLGRTAFVDFLERGPVRHRLVTELVSEGRPGCVVDALRHPGSGEFGGRYVADHDVIEPPHQIERELMLEIGTGIRDLGVQLRDMPLVLSRPLRFRQLFRRSSTELVIGQLLAGRKCDEVFQAEIDADTGADRICRLCFRARCAFASFSVARRPNWSLGSFSPVESVTKSFRPRSMPTPEWIGRA